VTCVGHGDDVRHCSLVLDLAGARRVSMGLVIPLAANSVLFNSALTA